MNDSGPQERALHPESRPLEELVGTLFEELGLAVELDRPSILLAVYESDFVRQEAEARLEGRLSELGQSVHHYQVDKEHFDVPLLLSQQSYLGKIVFFVTGLRWGGGKGGFNAYRALNLRREYFVDSRLRVVFWLTKKEAADLPRRAPDFWAFRHRVIEFTAPVLWEVVVEASRRLAVESRRPDRALVDLDAKIASREQLLADLPEVDESQAARADLLYTLAPLYRVKGEHTKSIRLLEQGLGIVERLGDRTSQAKFWVELGITYQYLDQEENALSAFQKAVELAPQNPGGWSHLARAYLEFGRLEGVLQAADRVVELSPQDADTWHNLGSVYRGLGRWDEARKAYKRALKLNPQSVGSWCQLGRVCRDLGRAQEALRAFNKVVKLEPHEASAWVDLGHIYRGLDRIRQAVGAFEKAVELSPESVPSRLPLAACYRSVGREDEAAEQIGIIRPKLDKENEYVQACFESFCGNVGKALKLLKIALEKRQASLEQVRRDPDLDPVRSDPRFTLLARE